MLQSVDAQPALHMVKIMRRFFDEVVNCPAFEGFMQELRVGYEEILNEELSSYALTLALAITELESAYAVDRDAIVAEHRGE
jgi:hypothetical protein